jgi:hypothetical protein
MTTTTNLFNTNLFTAYEEQQHREQDKILATRVLRQLWFDEGIDKGLTLGEYVESIRTPEDVLADEIFEEATRREQALNELAHIVELTADKFGIPLADAYAFLQRESRKIDNASNPTVRGAHALMRLNALQHGGVTYLNI